MGPLLPSRILGKWKALLLLVGGGRKECNDDRTPTFVQYFSHFTLDLVNESERT